MSHFCVLCIGDNWEEQLAKFHEFECTGTDNQYVQDINITDEAIEEYKSQSTTRYVDPDGNEHNPYADKFYRDPTPEEIKQIGPIAGTGGGNGISWESKDWGDGKYRTKIHFLPEGWEEVTVKQEEVESLLDFIEGWYGYSSTTAENLDTADEHKYGYVLVDEHGNILKVINRTNPNSKWDWYSIGGRWSGYFKVKPVRMLPSLEMFDSFGFSQAEFERLIWLYENKPEKFEHVVSKYTTLADGIKKAVIQASEPVYPKHATLGEAGLMGSCTDRSEGRADQLKKQDIDAVAMREEAEEAARELYDKFEKSLEHVGGILNFRSWDFWCTYLNNDMERVRQVYHSQLVVKTMKQVRDFTWYSPDDFYFNGGGRDKYVANAFCRVLVPFAVMKDGEWYEKGEMGWFGSVTDEKSQYDWSAKFLELYDNLPDDTLLTMVDCHI